MKKTELINVAFGNFTPSEEEIFFTEENFQTIYPEVFLKQTTLSRRKRLFGNQRNNERLYNFNAEAYANVSTRHRAIIERSYIRSRAFKVLQQTVDYIGKKLFTSKKAIQADVDAILNSNYFEPIWYADVSKVTGTNEELARHYLLVGFSILLDPSPQFSTEKYLAANPDILYASINPLVHYLRFGTYERRRIASVLEK